jgi:PAS domain-containing protein
MLGGMIEATATASVTAAELVRNFAAIRQRTSGAPMMITNHGRQSHVLCTIEQYRALAERPGGESEGRVPLAVAQLAAWIDQGTILIDAGGRIVHANAALLALAPYDPTRIIGRDIFEAMPEWAGTLAEAYLRRALGARETASFEMPTPFLADRWLHCRIGPVGDRLALLLRDITREVRGVREPAGGETMLRALDQNDHVAVVRLSPSGAIEAVHGRFAALVGLPDSRLIGVRFANLVDALDRHAVINAIERVIAGGEGDTVAARLIACSGDLAHVQIGIARAGAGRRSAGVTMVVSRDTAPDDHPAEG